MNSPVGLLSLFYFSCFFVLLSFCLTVFLSLCLSVLVRPSSSLIHFSSFWIVLVLSESFGAFLGDREQKVDGMGWMVNGHHRSSSADRSSKSTFGANKA